ncbi:MAG: TadE/TadG family type IV pilus assembly protein [Novosphingobium sp.]
MMRCASALKAVVRDRAGVTAVEFALIAPVLLLTLAGLYDVGNMLYTKSLLEGSMQRAARNSTIEGAGTNSASIDQAITQNVRNAAPGATLTFTRKAYTSFTYVSRPEDFTDVNGNGSCDSGEPYEDANGNLTWDADRGMSGQGSARDAVLYTARMTYPLPFPGLKLLGYPNSMTLTAQTVLRNQPYAGQAAPILTRNC